MRSPLLTLPAVSVLLVAFAVPDLALAQKKKADKETAAEDVNLDEESGDKDKGADKEESSEGESKPGDDGTAEGEGEKKDDAAVEATGAAPSDSGSDADKSPVEEKGKSYYFAGVRARALVVPTFIIEAFGEGGETVIGPQIGPEFSIRKDGFEYAFAITYSAYPMDRTPFKAPTDPDQAMELVESRIKVLYFTADFLWGHEFSPVVSLLYGGSAGLGFVWGPLYRSQAFRVNGGWQMCRGPGNPGGGYCDPDPEHGDTQHFGMYEEPSWGGGGNKPLIMPWLALQTGLRVKPHRRFVGRLDVGIGLGQVFFGIGADYGL